MPPSAPPPPTPPGTPASGGPSPDGGAPGTDSSDSSPSDSLATGTSSCTRQDVASVADPIFPGTGNMYRQEIDYVDARGLNLVRSYNSSLPGWVHNWGIKVRAGGTWAQVMRPDGRAHMFTGNGPGPWTAEVAAKERLVQLTPADASQPKWQYIAADDTIELYGADGALMSLASRGGMRYTAQHSGGLLRSITDSFGRSLQFNYDASNRLVSVKTPEGAHATYSYDGNGRLASATPAGSIFTTQYRYENASYPLALTGVIDGRGIRLATWDYDSAGRASAYSRAGGVDSHRLTYNADGSVTITDPLGMARKQSYVAAGPKKLFAGQDKPCANCSGDAASRVVDGNGLLQQSIDYLGIATVFTHDSQRKLPLSITRAAGLPEQQQVSVQWHAHFRLPLLVTEAGRTTAYVYDSLGNLTSQTITDTATGAARSWSWTYNAQGLPTGMTDPKGGSWVYVYDASGNRESTTNPLGQTTRFTYDAAGRMLSRTEPNGLVTQYSYEAGRLVMHNRGGEIIRYRYTEAGQLFTVTSPAGHEVVYTYDAAQRLVSVKDSRGSAIVYALDAMGNRSEQEVRDANGNRVGYEVHGFDAMNRLVTLSGAQGQTAFFHYDANGELVSETDPLHQTTRHTLDALRRTVATTFADDSKARQDWNALDQLTQVTDPKGVQTRYQTNAFGEVTSETSPDSGTTSYQRDATGAVASVTDAKGNTGTYTRDALGRTTRISYADQAQEFTYDTAGNLIQLADNSGSTAYTRDLLGRITGKAQSVNDNPAAPTPLNIGYAWHNGSLAGVTYPSGLKIFYQRTAGRITGIDVQEPGGTARRPKPVVPFVTGLTHTARAQPQSWNWSNGDTASRTFDADGRMVGNEFAGYTWDAGNRITAITQNLWASRTVVQGTTTVPELYTAPLQWTVQYDARNRIARFARPGSEAGYSYDANSNRLTGYDIKTSDTDLDGDFDEFDMARLTEQSSNVEAASNRLLGFTQTLTTVKQGRVRSVVNAPVNYSVDANGAMTSDGLRTFDYNSAGRLAKVKVFKNGEAASVAYLTNALGQRVFKSEPQAEQRMPDEAELGVDFIDWLRKSFGWLFNKAQTTTSIGTVYAYGDEGSTIPTWAILGEYDNGSAAGKGRTEYIWLPTEDGSAIPVGIYRNGKFFAVHTDHLGTPRLMTDEAKQPVWQWPYSAFGNNKPTGVLRATPKPQQAMTHQPVLLKATAAKELNLRFPGQYADEETGQFFNYFRSYDPKSGRYPTSDPIGMLGGPNRFAYVDGNPLNLIDPEGLMGRGGGGNGTPTWGKGGPASSKAPLPPVDDPCVMKWNNDNYGDVLGFVADAANLQMFIPSANDNVQKAYKDGAGIVASKGAVAYAPKYAGSGLMRAFPGNLAWGHQMGLGLFTFGGAASGVLEVAGAFMTPFATTAMAQAREACACRK